MKTSDLRTYSSNRLWISPIANSESLASPSFTSRQAAISSASGRLERPLKSWRRFFVTSSMPSLPSSGVVVASCSVERARPHTRGHVTAGRQRRERPDDGTFAHRGVLADGLLDNRPLTDGAIGEADVGSETDTGADDGVAVEHGAREQGDVGGQAHAGVDVGAVGV